MFKSLFRYATQRFKQTKNTSIKSGDLTLRKIDDCLFAIYNNFNSYSYYPKYLDWVNEETGETLAGFTPKPELSDLLNHRIDTNLE